MQKKAYISTLTEVTTVGKFNVFHMETGDKNAVVFSDQADLLSYIRENLGSVFALRFLKTTSKMYKYFVPTEDGALEV
ncbi:hypothetical protein KQH42_30375, partial [Streptomyces sp. CHA1]|uniref:hypothetical protein n=1 Tax=Streptomyces sp. CHA1 TaxID=2841663 RepID=UPI0020942BA8